MHKLEYIIVKGLFAVFSRISMKSGKKVALIIYFIVAKIIRYRKAVILENLHRVYGDNLPLTKKKLINAIYKNFVFLWMEFLQINHLNSVNLDEHFHFHDIELVDEVLSGGKGCIVISGHFGNFEWLGQFMNLKNYIISGIAKRQSNPYVNELIEKNRKQFGTKVIYTKSALQEGIKVLENNEILAIVTDQDARQKGIFVDFLGQPSSTAVGPAIFFLRTGAPILFIISIRKDYGVFDLYLEEVTHESGHEISDEKIHEITQLHTSILEKWVLKYPEQWFWMHRRWKTIPPRT